MFDTIAGDRSESLAVSCSRRRTGAVLAIASARLRAQTAVFEGTVLVTGTEKKLVDADVSLSDVNLSARSDSAGNFSMLHVPAGAHQLQIRLVGYEQYSAIIMFYEGRKFEADFLLKPAVTTLAKVNVKEKAANAHLGRLDEFDLRRKTSSGSYLTADVFAKADGKKTSDILTSQIPGIRTQCTGEECRVYTTRGPTFSTAGGNCYASVVVNGVMVYNHANGAPANSGQPLFDVNSINSSDIIGLEYHSVASIPPQYNATGTACGLLVIWTKGGGAS